jgi:hypothetical protein
MNYLPVTAASALLLAGAMTWAAAAPKPPAPAPSRPSYEPFPGAAFFHAGRHSPIVTAMGRRLVAEGCGRYNSGPGPNWTNADRNSYAAWQRKYSKANHLGWTDAGANFSVHALAFDPG